ncbi:hypothetical protein D3C72_942900 [compost metagenome]
MSSCGMAARSACFQTASVSAFIRETKAMGDGMGLILLAILALRHQCAISGGNTMGLSFESSTE